MNIDTLLQAAEYIERRERGKNTLRRKLPQNSEANIY